MARTETATVIFDILQQRYIHHGRFVLGKTSLAMGSGPSLLFYVARIVGWCLLFLIVLLSLVPPGLRPETGAPSGAEHFGIFVLTGAALCLGYPKIVSALSMMLVAFAGTVEVLQLLVPGRHARFSDFVVDSIAAIIGVVLVRWLRISCSKGSAVS